MKKGTSMAKKNNRQNITVAPETGRVFKLRHERFGKAVVTILNQYSEWIEVRIISGTLRGAREDWEPGDTKTVRREHCFFSPK